MGVGAVSEIEDVQGLSGRELDDALLSLDREARRIEALTAAVIARASQTGHHAEDGHSNVRAWAKATCNWSRSEASARVALAHTIRDLPIVGAALADGSIGIAQARELARLHANPRCADQLPASIALLVEHARTLWFDDFRVVCRRWEALADADGAHSDHDRAHAERRASINQVGTGFDLRASGSAVDGELIRQIFDRFVDAEFHADWDEARERFGDQLSASLMARSSRQRRFDALRAIFVAAAGANNSASAAPVVSLVCDLDSFQRHVNAYFDQPTEPIDPASVTTRRCETQSGIPVDPREMVAAALIGRIRRVIVGSSGRVLDLGRRRRLFTGAAREAVLLAETRCVWPGCDVSAGRAEIDHTTSWGPEQGRTRPDNGGVLCGHHNRWKTNGYRTWRDPTGQWHTLRPDGTEIAPRTG